MPNDLAVALEDVLWYVLIFQETTAYNVCTLAGKEYPKKMFKVRYGEGGNAYSTGAATRGVL